MTAFVVLVQIKFSVLRESKRRFPLDASRNSIGTPIFVYLVLAFGSFLDVGFR